MRELRTLAIVCTTLAVGLLSLIAQADEAAVIRIDCNRSLGAIRPLHGVNGGPLNQGETLDVSALWREAGIPITRLHDCEWPSGRVVDMHSLFPVPSADPADPKSYRFAETDAYLAAVRATGAKLVFRLGESIEHSKLKYHVHPPADADRWAEACCGVVRHYNEGWADGQHLGIDYWEIWNEPENRPVMWTGDDEQFFQLFMTTAKRLKQEYPKIKVGGPAVGAVGELVDDLYHPTPFVRDFMARCQREKLQLDFFSWHTYSDDPAIYRRKAKAIRQWLDEQGWQKTEQHLNEWNYLPANDWGKSGRDATAVERRKWYGRMAGPEGAAFVAYVLCDLQDSSIDVANYFHGDASPFGLFTQFGEPKKTYFAMKAFNQLVQRPERVSVDRDETGKWIACAAIDRKQEKLTVLLSNYSATASEFQLSIEGLPWQGASEIRCSRLDADHDLTDELLRVDATPKLAIDCPPPGVVVVDVTRRK